MEILWKKLIRLQLVLRKFNRLVSDLHKKIIEVRTNLENAYEDLRSQQMNTYNIDRVRVYTKELVKWNEVEEKILQRTKIKWFKMGDRNNAFFHAYLKVKGNANSMQFFHKEDGTVVTTQKDIEDEFFRLYRNLMGKANNKTIHIDVEAMRKGKQIGMYHSNLLISQVTNDEIVEALKGIGDQISPGVDVYGS